MKTVLVQPWMAGWFAVAAFFGSCLPMAFAAEGPAVRPHIILVMADDQGWGDCGVNGHPLVQTPALDAMAAEGFQFTRFHAAAPVCSPSRAAVLTGRHPIRVNVPDHGHYLRPGGPTLPGLLRDAGYVTGMFGKYHVGSAQAESPANPGAIGFNEWVIGLNFFDKDPYLSRNGVVEHRQGRGTELAMDDTLDFLERHRTGDRPMFAVCWFPSPHDPHQELPDGGNRYGNHPAAGYFNEITLLDQQVGRLRTWLREHDLQTNTLLWYTSDNGGLLPASSGGRGKKGVVYEGGLRVPCFVEWPARDLRGVSDLPAVHSDMLPTLLRLAGVPTPEGAAFDGVDLSDAFTGRMTTRPPIGFWHSFTKGQSTRSDHILKAIMDRQQAGLPPPHDPPRLRKNIDEVRHLPIDHAPGHAAWLDAPWKLHRIDGDRYALYHLGDDPMESRDLADDPAHAARVAAMKEALLTWQRSVVADYNGTRSTP